MDWDLLRAVATAVLGVVTLVAAALVGLLVGTMRTLRDSNADLRLRVGDLETERTNDKKTIASTASENGLLRNMLTGKVEWLALTDQLEEHHRQALAEWKKTSDVLAKILSALGGAE